MIKKLAVIFADDMPIPIVQLSQNHQGQSFEPFEGSPGDILRIDFNGAHLLVPCCDHPHKTGKPVEIKPEVCWNLLEFAGYLQIQQQLEETDEGKKTCSDSFLRKD